MIQLFLKTSKIANTDWDDSYNRIFKIVNQFPLKLERIESYDGFTKNTDKLHYDLTVNKNEKDEHISFWGDQMSYTADFSVKFYKHWEVQQKKGLIDNEKDPTKPIIWYLPEVFKFSSYPPDANAAKLNANYLDTKALYRYAVLAIGIMLENTLPGRAFLISLEIRNEEVNNTRKWLEYIFDESFDMPIYYDKTRLLDNVAECYNNKTDLVGRLDILYFRQFKTNMEFALQQIGYKSSLEYYSQVLAHTDFGTFGFSDVFTPWIEATKSLEKTLELLEGSKQILLSDPKDEHAVKKASKYDYIEILKDLLSQYILWTPEQREFLDNFYTNQQSLESGTEDLFGTLMRMSGLRVDICPIYATPDHLFEVFMYHDSKNGKQFRAIIDDWLDKNKNRYDEVVKRFSGIEKKVQEEVVEMYEREEEKDLAKIELESRIEKYLNKYADPERFLVKKALDVNPYHLETDSVVDALQQEMFQRCKRKIEDIKYRHKIDKTDKIEKLNYWIKQKGLFVLPAFTEWLNKESDTGIITCLYVLTTLKLYDRRQSYARQQILLNRKYWTVWEMDGKYSIEKL